MICILKNDILLLADVFENLFEICVLKYVSLILLIFLSPGLTGQAALK